MNNPRSAAVVGRILRVGVVRALVPVPFADVDVPVRGERDHHRLPQKPLPFRFIPVSSSSPLAEPEEHLPIGTDFRDGRGAGGCDPDIVLSVDRHAVRLGLIADHVGFHLKDELVVRIELEELRLSFVCALKHPEIPFRVERNRRNPAEPWRKYVWIFERIAERLFPLDALQRLPRSAATAPAQGRASASGY